MQQSPPPCLIPPHKGCTALANHPASLVLFPQVKHNKVKLNDSATGVIGEGVGEIDRVAFREKRKLTDWG